MAYPSGRTRCVKCNKERATSKCGGCSQDFCLNDLIVHRQQMSNELDNIQTIRDLFRQALTDHMSNLERHSIIEEIDQWQEKSIGIIKRTAQEAKKIASDYLSLSMSRIEKQLNQLTDEIRQTRDENDFFETDLRRWSDVLNTLQHQLSRPADITIQYNADTTFVKKIEISTEGKSILSYDEQWSDSTSI